MKSHLKLIPIIFILVIFSQIQAQTNPQKVSGKQSINWNYYRGSNLDGVSLNKDLPLTWSENENIVWKTPIHGKGASSPVVFGDQIWITTGDSTGKKLFAVCMSLKTGKVIHDLNVFEPDSIPPLHNLNTHATPTPAIEDGFVFVHFGTMGTACLESASGKVVWKRTDMKCNYVQGAASSPIIYKNMLILHFEGVDIQYIVALDKKTGKTIWKSIRPQELYVNQPAIARKAFITPIIVNVDGKDMLISNGAEVCIAYNPTTGEEIWRIPYTSDTTISMPMFSNGLVIFTTGLMEPIKLMGVKPSGKGDITNTNVVWTFSTKDIPAINSPVIKDGLLYMIHERGVLTCLEAETGKVVYTNKLKGEFYSSPICADGKIYFFSKKGTIYVLQEGREFKLLAENHLDGEYMATLAVSGKSLLVRSNKALYRIENAK
jgi:outer membrane protein assembly factor BamB